MKLKILHLIALKLIALFLFSTNMFSQVGIGTLTPNASSMLDVESTTMGMLTPRMTSAQRIAISNPANGLLVYDTSENAFYFYKTSVWIKIDSKVRNNYKLIKSVTDLSSELSAGGGSKYLLTSNTLYEINGAISLAHPIDINNASIMGLDNEEDRLINSSGGAMFTGSAGGMLKGLTLISAGSVFNLTGGVGQTLIFRDLAIAYSASVGTIEGYDLIFLGLVYYFGNTNGITYSNIKNLLLSNTGWLDTNFGVYETYSGTFNFIQKQGGFMTINGTAKGMDVSSNPTVSNGVITDVRFSGTSTEYIKKYTSGSSPGYNFNNVWTVNCPGIKLESDEFASANIFYNGGISTGFLQYVYNSTSLNLTGSSNSNTTTAVNLLRTTSPQNNRITYTGKKTRTFQVSASLSVRGNTGTGDFYAFFIRKNGTTTLTETNTLMRVNNTSDISSNSIVGTVELAPNDYIEIWGQRLVGTGTTSLTIFSLNLNIN